MLRTWLATGMLVTALSLVGCDDGGHEDADLGGSGDNLKGRNEETKPSEQDAGALTKDDPRDEEASACAALLCPTDTKCVVKEVQCIRAPCPPIASCEPIDVPATCAATLCKEGTTCVEGPNGAECVHVAGCLVTFCVPPTVCVDGRGCVEPTGPSCAAVQCEQGDYCVETSAGGNCVEHVPQSCSVTVCTPGKLCVEGPNGATCVPPGGPSCAAALCVVGNICVEGPLGATCVLDEARCNAKCSALQHCELQEVQCIQAPCPLVPTCVDDLDPCATVKCKAGTHCVWTQPECFTAPCPPFAECVPN